MSNNGGRHYRRSMTITKGSAALITAVQPPGGVGATEVAFTPLSTT
ncbi:MAG: hypothetical protein LBT00_15680 [Spirochaetaceae bacterium]|nr:hypothetical protein [Spirochaetaceae bacterium]